MRGTLAMIQGAACCIRKDWLIRGSGPSHSAASGQARPGRITSVRAHTSPHIGADAGCLTLMTALCRELPGVPGDVAPDHASSGGL